MADTFFVSAWAVAQALQVPVHADIPGSFLLDLRREGASSVATSVPAGVRELSLDYI